MKLLVVLTASLTAELIHLILKVHTFRLTVGASSDENTRLRSKSGPVGLHYGRDFQIKPGNKNIKTAILAAAEHLKWNKYKSRVFLPLLRLPFAVLFFNHCAF